MSLGPSIESQLEAERRRLFYLRHELHDGIKKTLSAGDVRLLMDNRDFDLLSEHLGKLDFGENSDEERKTALLFITRDLFRHRPWKEGATGAEVAIKYRELLADGKDEVFSRKLLNEAIQFGHLRSVLGNLDAFDAPTSKEEFITFIVNFIQDNLLERNSYSIDQTIDLSEIQKIFVLTETERFLLEQIISDAEEKRKKRFKRGI